MKKKLETLNGGDPAERLETLKQIIRLEPVPRVRSEFSNNHIHSFFSFSPYSPTEAVYYARKAGLPTAGIMDHDSIAGAKEFIRAGEIAGIATTVGLECRVGVEGTPLEGKIVNNPDQASVVYITLHGVPHHRIDDLQELFQPYREKRNVRNRIMAERLSELLGSLDLRLDFDRDVVPTSKYQEGGSITERHLLYALSLKMIEKIGKGPALAAFIKNKLDMPLSSLQAKQLNDLENPYYEYDLLGMFKAGLIDKIFVPATDEVMHISELIKVSAEIGSLLAYPYLGDVTDSVTGDKKTQKFEDDYLDLLFEVLKEWNIDAFSYMPSRNTPDQIRRIQEKCRQYRFFEISGEDINSPRQPFICRQLARPEFSHLTDSTWALIEYEKKASEGAAQKPVRKEQNKEYNK
ncbi:MAG TPA: PHP domain-containing protein [Anaerovoracaceae bacterium]|nr:PHP domain-containing protein [Anaerovoracaceae bacterium]